MLRLKLIKREAWAVYAACTADGSCPLEEFLGDGSSLRKDKDRMLRRLEEVSRRGPYYLPDISHQIEGEIRQTEQGRIRVLWFFDKGHVIVCSHGFVKKSKKTPEREKATARRTLNAYHEAVAANALIVLED